MLNALSPHYFPFDSVKPTQTHECPACRATNIQKLDIEGACCNWVDNPASCKAIFSGNAYYKDSGFHTVPIAWYRYFEKELVNFDGNFKSIVSYLGSKESDSRLVPDLCKSKDGKFKVYYPLFQEICKKEIPKTNTLNILSFLKYEGALQKERITFSFCTSCGAKNELGISMEERECGECGYKDNPDCDENCPEYDAEAGGCSTSRFPKICCFILPNGDCLGPKYLETECRNCGEETTDNIVNFDPNEEKGIESIIDPEYCNCLGVQYRLITDVLQKLNQGFTFQEMISEAIKAQGWNTTSGRKLGKSGISQDVDILCEKDTKRVLVECKRLISTKGIDLDVVLNLFARMTDLGIDKGLIVTTTPHVSPEAVSFAGYYGIEILNVHEMLTGNLESIFWRTH